MKKPPRSFGFNERLDFSHGHAPDVDSVFDFLRYRIPNFKSIRKAAAINDRTGTDYYVERIDNFSLGIDLKLRSEDFSIKPPDYLDDLALEIESVIETSKIGWTRDGSRTADYILWFWEDTGRFFIVPFPPLCYVFQNRWQEWSAKYRTATQATKNGHRGWHSRCVFVPRQIVVDTIMRWCSGQIRMKGA